MAAPPIPRIILGTMTYGGQTSKTDAAAIVTAFATDYPSLVGPVPELDTARMYCSGGTETMIGELARENPALKMSIATKANPFMGKSLSAAGLSAQVDASLKALAMESVDIFYLHGPDANAVIEETLGAVQRAFEAGKFSRFAISNFTAWETVWIHGFMGAKGWVQPRIYQGMLNAITRGAMLELLPALRRCGMAFYAYNPLAGGMLTGKHTRDGDRGGPGRFTSASAWGKIYQDRFMQEPQFQALDIVLAACAAVPEDEGGPVPPAEAALRWCAHHAGLSAERGDGIIVGASSVAHFEANMAALGKGPLPPSVVAAYDDGWETCRASAPEYQRGVSGSSLS